MKVMKLRTSYFRVMLWGLWLVFHINALKKINVFMFLSSCKSDLACNLNDFLAI